MLAVIYTGLIRFCRGQYTLPNRCSIDQVENADSGEKSFRFIISQEAFSPYITCHYFENETSTLINYLLLTLLEMLYPFLV